MNQPAQSVTLQGLDISALGLSGGASEYAQQLERLQQQYMQEQQRLHAQYHTPAPVSLPGDNTIQQNRVTQLAQTSPTPAEQHMQNGGFASVMRLQIELLSHLVTADNWQTLDPHKIAALFTIVGEIAQLANGNANRNDSWANISITAAKISNP